MQNILELAIHQLAQESGLGKMRLPQRSYPDLLGARLPQIRKPAKDVRELLVKKHTEQRLEVPLVKPPRLASGWFDWLLLLLVLTLREMRDDPLDEFVLVSAHRCI